MKNQPVVEIRVSKRGRSNDEISQSLLGCNEDDLSKGGKYNLADDVEVVYDRNESHRGHSPELVFWVELVLNTTIPIIAQELWNKRNETVGDIIINNEPMNSKEDILEKLEEIQDDD